MNRFKKVRRSESQAFTLVELLVVIAIIGILVALLLPAIQAAREAARRSQCTNNLKQIGIAMHNYEGTHKTLPYGSVYGRELPEGGAAPGGNWVTEVSPFLEEQNVFDQFDFDQLLTVPRNANIAAQVIVQSFICPSDELASNPILRDRRPTPNNPPVAQGLWYPASMGPTIPDQCTFVPNNDPYIQKIACLGCGYGSVGSDGLARAPCSRSYTNEDSSRQKDPCEGMVCRSHIGVPFRRVTDGLSKTIMAGETLPAHSSWNCLFCENFPIASTHIPINIMENDIGLTPGTGEHWRIAGYKSMHPGGINVVMGDGSVTFLSETIDYVIYNMMGSRSRGDNAAGS